MGDDQEKGDGSAPSSNAHFIIGSASLPGTREKLVCHLLNCWKKTLFTGQMQIGRGVSSLRKNSFISLRDS